MRYFIAVDLPEKIKETLKNIKFDNSAILVLPSDYHLTLKFLGDVNESKLERVKRELHKIKFKPFKLRLSSIEFFPRKGNFIRVIWMGITPKRKVIKLKEDIDNILMSLFEREKIFEPHVTLGRVKTIKDRKKLLELRDLQIHGRFNVDNFKLIKSELAGDGAKYEILEEYS
ncbi:MAG: RNA 2',3'-cyclic phosphodiesterase [Nanoarchaeota archaeon]